MNFGVVKFLPIESVINPSRGLDREARSDRINDLLANEPVSQGVSEWPLVNIAIRRGDLFIIEASTPAFTALLSFSQERLAAGDYKIRHLPRGRIETGKIIKVSQLNGDDVDSFYSMLNPFKERFLVTTLGNERPHVKMIWLVGLNYLNMDDGTDKTG